jgi:ribosomal protein L29
MAKKVLLTEKNVEQLTEMLGKEREELRTLRFSAAGSRPKDSAAPKKSRAQVARLLTELHARKIEAPVATEVEAATA